MLILTKLKKTAAFDKNTQYLKYYQINAVLFKMYLALQKKQFL